MLENLKLDELAAGLGLITGWAVSAPYEDLELKDE